jgi:16S rRNA pseudouridine516 synthase
MPRIDQLLASLGYGSRRDIGFWARAGRITVRGVVEKDAGRHADAPEVRVDGEPLDHPGEILLMVNKPEGRVCSHDPSEGPNVYGLLPVRWQKRNPPVTSVGRLDKETTGLLLLTDRSELVHRLTSPKHKVVKVYRVSLDRDIPAGLDEAFRSGFQLPGDDRPVAPAVLRRIGEREAEVDLTEGRYHQVRRMFAAHGCTVVGLDRIRYGSLALGPLARGAWIVLPINCFDK